MKVMAYSPGLLHTCHPVADETVGSIYW